MLLYGKIIGFSTLWAMIIIAKKMAMEPESSMAIGMKGFCAQFQGKNKRIQLDRMSLVGAFPLSKQ